MANWRKICCAVDFSESSRLALEEAADLARRFDGALTLIHVFETVPVATTEGIVSPPDLVEQLSVELSRKLESWKAEAERRADRPVRQNVLSGDPATEIVRFAREGEFDLVITGTHGRTGLKHLVLGSVAEKVVRQAHCPVLVVRRGPELPEVD